MQRKAGGSGQPAPDTSDSRAGTDGRGSPGHPAPARGNVKASMLWFGLFGAAAAWSVLEVVNYSIAAHACYPGMFPLHVPIMGKGGLWGITIAVTVVTLGVAVAAGIVAWGAYRQTRTETGGDSGWALETGEGRTRFMALSGVMMSSVIIVDILFHLGTILVLSPC